MKLTINDINRTEWFERCDKLRKLHPTFPVALPDIPNYITWYKKNNQYATEWDKDRFKFCQDAINCGLITETKK